MMMMMILYACLILNRRGGGGGGAIKKGNAQMHYGEGIFDGFLQLLFLLFHKLFTFSLISFFQQAFRYSLIMGHSYRLIITSFFHNNEMDDGS